MQVQPPSAAASQLELSSSGGPTAPPGPRRILSGRQGLALVLAFAVAITLLRGGNATGPRAPAPSGLTAQWTTPGGLTPEQTPQFVLLTQDDLVNGKTRDLIRAVTDGRQTSNGCPLAATLFVKVKNPDCEAVQELHAAGYELADHTITHKRLPGQDRSFVETDVLAARSQLAECGIPEADIVGFRAPYLDVNPQLRQVLYQHGFLYDSSFVVESADGFGFRLWPFDMGGGIPFPCASYAGSYSTHNQTCSSQERWPGLWQIPVWQLTQLEGSYTMDPGFSYDGMYQASVHSAFDILKANFDVAYAGNRAPMPVFVHPFFLQTGNNLADVQRFADYALTHPDVYFVTMRQLLAWMRNPIPANQLTPRGLGCGNPGGAGPPEPQQREGTPLDERILSTDQVAPLQEGAPPAPSVPQQDQHRPHPVSSASRAAGLPSYMPFLIAVWLLLCCLQ